MLDVIAGRVHGAVQAKDVRIVWTDGVLYICHTSGKIESLRTTEPTRYGAFYKCETDTKNVTFQPPGCGSCRRRVAASKVGQMSVEEIVAAGKVDA